YFPAPPREPVVLDVSTAKGPPYVLAGDATNIGLERLPMTAGLGSLSGTVNSSSPGGTMVLVGGKTGIADADGKFVVFNVPSGDPQVEAVKAGFNFDIATTTIPSDTATPNVAINANSMSASTVSGSVQIVNGGAATATSVVLVLEDTFDPNLNRGDSPSGL